MEFVRTELSNGLKRIICMQALAIMDKPHTITDLDIQALIDEAMDGDFAAYVWQAIENDPILHNRYLVYKKQKDLLKLWWKDN